MWAADNTPGNIDWVAKQGPGGWSPWAPAPEYNASYNPTTLDCVAAGFGGDPIKWGAYDCIVTKLPFLCAPKGAGRAGYCARWCQEAGQLAAHTSCPAQLLWLGAQCRHPDQAPAVRNHQLPMLLPSHVSTPLGPLHVLLPH